MFAFLNDLSIAPGGCHIVDNWAIIKRLIDNLSELEKYNIRKVRVPQGFLHLPIANSHSLAHHVQNSTGDKLKLLLGILANRMIVADTEITAQLEEAQIDTVIDVKMAGATSQLLTEAYVMDCPSVSLGTIDVYRQNFLNCDFDILTSNNAIISENIELPNIHNEESFTGHRIFLSNWKQKIAFAKTKWDPQADPIWNDHTATILERCKFPLSAQGKKDKKTELREVGTMVAELNAWKYDERVTKKNRNAGQMRKIFQSKSGAKDSYLSIDFKNAYGRFELHDHKGKHLREIKFINGEESDEGDGDGYHDIEV